MFQTVGRFWGLIRAFSVRLLIPFGLLVTPAIAQDWPSADYDTDIPTLKSVVGHTNGEDISSIPEIQTYLKALEAAAHDRMDLHKYATSWEGRDLVYAVISSPENMARLNEIKANLNKIASGKLSSSELDRLTKETPPVVWLSYGVHGDEISPPDSSIFVAYHLLAAKNVPLVDQILENTIVIIDPSQNPDGRMRFHNSFNAALGLEPFGDRMAAEHDQPWPGGRFNHYLFDLNRDWFALTQPETKGKVANVLAWHPVVYVDSHEMGGDSTYYFPPPADPINPNIPQEQRERLVEMGKNNAAWFDEYGVPYFTREVYDAFYPGYGDMWPALNGATAMTFEQSSARGLIFDRRDGNIRTYVEGVCNNVLTSLSTLQVVSGKPADYLKDYAGYRAAAINAGKGLSDRFYVFDLSKRDYEAETLGRTLAAQNIEVKRLPAGANACGKSYPKGALVVDLSQAQGRLATTLLQPTTDLPADFAKEQEALRAHGIQPDLYDVVAWSLPLMFGVETSSCGTVSLTDADLLTADAPIPASIDLSGAYGQIIPWNDAGQAKLVIAALKAGLTGKATSEAFVQDGVSYPAGSVVFVAKDNPARYDVILSDLAREIGADFAPMSSSWVSDGPNIGSYAFAKLKLPKIALIWDEGTNPSAAGNSRFVLERQLGLPVTPIRSTSLARANLKNYDVLIIPETRGRLGNALGAGGISNIKSFTSNGGTLIAFGNATGLLASDDFGMLASGLESMDLSGEADKQAGPAESGAADGTLIKTEDEYNVEIRDDHARPDNVPGVLARVIADPHHWLSAGYDEATVLYNGTEIYRPLTKAEGWNVFHFADADTLLESGYLWEENKAQLAYKPYLMEQGYGVGHVIAFTQSPTTRAYLNGLNLLLANAVLFGPVR